MSAGAGCISSNSRSSNPALPGARLRSAQGFTLLELMLTTAVCALLLAIGVPGYRGIVERQKASQCASDLMLIALQIEKHRTAHGSLPLSLAELSGAPATDPWGFDYRYLNFEAGTPGIAGMIRKDHNLHPLNTEFDLYSVGPDGQSASPVTAAASRDDVIWAHDGSFVGIAADL